MKEQYDSYKDSGVPWIGQVPAGWEVRRLSHLAHEHYMSNKGVNHQNLLSLSYGKVIRKDIKTTDGLLPQSFDGYQIVEKGNIILRLTDLQNDHKSLRVGLVNEEGIITSAYLCLQCTDAVLPEYLYLVLHVNDIHKVFYGMGAGVRQSLNYDGIRNMAILLPPLPVQRAIACYLDGRCAAIDAYVASLEREAALARELKQAVIARAVTRGLDPNTPMRDSGIPWIGQVPQGWEIDELGRHFRERCTKVSDKEYEPLSVSKHGITPQLETACKTDNGDNRKLVCKGDFVVNSRSDRKGSCGLSDYEGSVSLINTVLTPIDMDGKYCHYLFRSNDYIEEFYRLGRGIVADLWTTRYDDMKVLKIPLPPLPEQRAIAGYLDARCAAIDAYVASLEREAALARELKQREIADAVTGKVKITA